MLVSFIRVLANWFPNEEVFSAILNVLPLARFNLEWVLPAILTFVITCFALGRNLNLKRNQPF